MKFIRVLLRINPILLIALVGLGWVYSKIYLFPSSPVPIEKALRSEFDRGTGGPIPDATTDVRGYFTETDFHGDYGMFVTFSAPADFLAKVFAKMTEIESERKVAVSKGTVSRDDSNSEVTNLGSFKTGPETLSIQWTGPGDLMRSLGIDRSAGRVFFSSDTW